MRRFLKRFGIGAAVVFAVAWLLSGFVATYLTTSPRQHKVMPPGFFAGLPLQDVTVTTGDGLALSAWYIPKDPERAVVTLSGIRSDRREMCATAKAYSEWGFTVLMPDLRGVGQSAGNLVSMGYYERQDLEACIAWLRERGYKRIGAHGMSMGAATLCFAMKDTPGLDFAVVESSFDTFKHAIDRRLELVYLPHVIGWPFEAAMCLRLGVSMRGLSPLEYVSYCTCPALFLCGDSERFLTVSDTQTMFDRCGSEKKKLHVFMGGHHRTSMNTFPEESRRVLREFLNEKAGYAIP